MSKYLWIQDMREATIERSKRVRLYIELEVLINSMSSAENPRKRSKLTFFQAGLR